jgi:fucose 4-O-acetylase-like acetyltransferase
MAKIFGGDPMSVQRMQKWDILKFFLIFLVVAGHIADLYVKESGAMKALFMAIYTFHMPLFIFVSGLFAKRTVNEKKKDRIAGYLVLYIVIKFILWIYSAFRYGNVKFSIFSEGGLPWFMFVLFAYAVITIVSKDFSPKFILPMSILLACLAGYDGETGTFLSAARIIAFYPYYYLGYLFDIKKIEEHCKKKEAKIAAGVIIGVFVIISVFFGERFYWLRPLLTGVNPFSTLGTCAKFGFLFRLGNYAVSGIISYAVIVLTPETTRFGIAAKYGRRTLPIYALHYIFIYILYYNFDIRSLLQSIAPAFDEWLAILLAIPITFVSALPIFDKFFNKISAVPLKK